MTEIACKPLTEHFERKWALGLVDIKFYVHNEGDATEAKVCAEAVALFEAIDKGAVEDFHFNDSRMRARA